MLQRRYLRVVIRASGSWATITESTETDIFGSWRSIHDRSNPLETTDFSIETSNRIICGYESYLYGKRIEALQQTVHNFIHNSHIADKGLQAFFNNMFTYCAHPSVDKWQACPRSWGHAMMPSRSFQKEGKGVCDVASTVR